MRLPARLCLPGKADQPLDSAAGINNACGEDTDCINRATKMECIGDCSCGAACQNQRFQLKQYAKVAVIKTEKKGYGLRAETNLRTGEFIFEYIGEVINEQHFRRRMVQYDEEGIKHFYFMSLSKGEFVDATKKGNLGRFCNHSCNPNCYVDKWVVGEKLRMGIFAERNVKAGEELVFNYNVDRYGADPQPCYCGEPNCSGYIGGKTQTERATKLSHTTIEALGIDDGDGWDVAVAKKPRKKKTGEDDEEYVNNVQPKSLEEGGVTKVMATLMQCKEKWIAVKLLSRIQRSDDEKVGHRVIRMHGYTILKKTLANWNEDFNVILQVLDILEKLPRITRNKIQDSKIEETMQQFKACGDERVETRARALLEIWSKLEIGYRIPRMKRDPNAGTPVRVDRFERREKARERSKSRTKSPEPVVDAPKGPSVPAGPRGAGLPPRNAAFLNGPRAFRRPPPFNALPPGWFQAVAENGTVYYYSANGQTQWQRPTVAASQPPPPPPKEKSHEQKLQDIIASITQNANQNPDKSASATPQPANHDVNKDKKAKREKWRSLSLEKQQRLYENTVSCKKDTINTDRTDRVIAFPSRQICDRSLPQEVGEG
jgi:histone-lysine N-methyltransferase SETD2